LNLNYACSCVIVISYLIHIHFLQIYIFECLKCNDKCSLVNMLCLKNWTVRFYKAIVPVFMVLLTKPDDLVSQTELSSFDRLIICFSNFICCDSLVMCIT
jgi:hypothetical protein